VKTWLGRQSATGLKRPSEVLALAVSVWLLSAAFPAYSQDPVVELDEAARAAEQRLREQLPADSEAMAMLEAIAQGRSMSRNDGWFKMATSQTAYSWESMIAAYDQDQDGQLSAVEFPGPARWFSGLDRNRDGVLSAEDHRWNVEPSPQTLLRTIRRMDADDDGRITREEFNRFGDSLLSGEQAYWSVDELRLALDPPPKVQGLSNERPTPSQLMIGLEKQEIGSHLPGPSVGDVGMDFTLKTVDGKAITLSDWCAEKPVVLIFGNFTCGPFRAEAGNLERLYERYRDHFHFLVVYVREAHPSDGWAMRRNEAADIVLAQPTKYPERAGVAEQCLRFMGGQIPLVVDEMDDPVGRQYSGMPSRLYLLDAERQVLFKSGRGPHYFNPAELEEALLWHLTETDLSERPAATQSAADMPRQPIPGTLSSSTDRSAEAWQRLGIQFPQLPEWAIRLSEPLPASTIALLELDYRHRLQNPLGSVVAAQLRWIVADALESDFGKQTAHGDLLRAGWSEETFATWVETHKSHSSAEQTLWDFARQLTLAGHAISDESFAELGQTHAAADIVAIVHTVAFANFQNRLQQAILEADAPGLSLGPVMPPLDWRASTAVAAPPRPTLEELAAPQEGKAVSLIRAGWELENFATIRNKLSAQKNRSPRIPLPDPALMEFLPPEERQRSEKVIWSRISLSYQPELTQGWFKLMRTFRQESNLDRVFSNSMFWVVTRTNQCFY
jgi:thiol-disulfide isomerase/thioredoxin